jgi:hypothetical protein
VICFTEVRFLQTYSPLRRSQRPGLFQPFPSLKRCNALNLGVEFFSSFLSPNSGVTLFSLSPFAPSSQFQTSIAASARVMYKPKPKSHGCCIMPKRISLPDDECSSRSVPDFGSRFNSV